MSKPEAVALVPTHLVGGVGGATAWMVAIPFPWLIGTIAPVAAGAPTLPRRTLRDGVVLLITGIGLTVTPAAGGMTLRLLPLILGAAAVTVTVGRLACVRLARVGGIDRTTAFFCSVPGGSAQMSVLGAREGAAGDFDGDYHHRARQRGRGVDHGSSARLQRSSRDGLLRHPNPHGLPLVPADEAGGPAPAVRTLPSIVMRSRPNEPSHDTP